MVKFSSKYSSLDQVLSIIKKCKVLYLIVLLMTKLPFFLYSQESASLSFTVIPFSEPDLIAPGRGAEHWGGHLWDDVDALKIPTGNAQGQDYYWRFTWRNFETKTQGVYNWTEFDKRINYAIDKGKKLSFGIMTVDGSVYRAPTVGGAYLTYPDYLHNQMQSESNKDWIGAGMWIPNWNSAYYLTALKNLNVAINHHLNNTTYKGILYKNAIFYIDVRGYGNFGEWHTYPFTRSIPPGREATAATLKAIIDGHTSAFRNHPLVVMSDGFATWGSANTPPEVVMYLLNTRNEWGPLGWRRDNWGNPEYDQRLIDNPAVYNGAAAKALIMTRWKTAPVVGETWRGKADVSDNGKQCPYYDLERQIRLYHATSFGNGNYESLTDQCIRENIRKASKASGYRLILEGGSVSSTIVTGTSFSVTLQWKNVGIAPTYENWNVVFELKNGSNAIVWSGTSQFRPKLFLPRASCTAVTDNFTLPSTIAPGTYTLNLIIKDPTGYRKPLPLAITGRNIDGSYTLKTVVVSPNIGQTNIVPLAEPGSVFTTMKFPKQVSLLVSCFSIDLLAKFVLLNFIQSYGFPNLPLFRLFVKPFYKH